jgi:ABC-type sulfate transport system permease subunit
MQKIRYSIILSYLSLHMVSVYWASVWLVTVAAAAVLGEVGARSVVRGLARDS